MNERELVLHYQRQYEAERKREIGLPVPNVNAGDFAKNTVDYLQTDDGGTVESYPATERRQKFREAEEAKLKAKYPDLWDADLAEIWQIADSGNCDLNAAFSIWRSVVTDGRIGGQAEDLQTKGVPSNAEKMGRRDAALMQRGEAAVRFARAAGMTFEQALRQV